MNPSTPHKHLLFQNSSSPWGRAVSAFDIRIKHKSLVILMNKFLCHDRTARVTKKCVNSEKWRKNSYFVGLQLMCYITTYFHTGNPYKNIS